MSKVGRKPGTPKTGGKKKGSLNKKTVELTERLRAKYPGFCPIEQMIQFVQDEENSAKERADMCKDIAPYLYPKRKSVEHSGDGGGPLKGVIDFNFHKPEKK